MAIERRRENDEFVSLRHVYDGIYATADAAADDAARRDDDARGDCQIDEARAPMRERDDDER